MANAVRKGELYPVAEDATLPRGWERKTTRVRATGEKRAPRAGEWFLSGAIVEGHDAPHDISREHHIGELVRGEIVSYWREVRADG